MNKFLLLIVFAFAINQVSFSNSWAGTSKQITQKKDQNKTNTGLKSRSLFMLELLCRAALRTFDHPIGPYCQDHSNSVALLSRTDIANPYSDLDTYHISYDPHDSRPKGVEPLPVLEVQEAREPEEQKSAKNDGYDSNLKFNNPYGVENLYWAQNMVAAGPMKAEVRKILSENQLKQVTEVAILDVEFSRKYIQNKDFIQSETEIEIRNIKATELGYESHPTQRPDRAPVPYDDGHGTAVAGLISGKKIGMVDQGISLTLYETVGFDWHQSKPILEATQQICSEKSNSGALTIINLSMGSYADEGARQRVPSQATERDEVLYKEIIEDFADKGCLVVVAAGNHAYRGAHSNKLTDAYLRVQGVNEKGEVDEHSSIGEVSAPYIAASLTIKPADYTWPGRYQPCDSRVQDPDYNCTFFVGTSFSAPIVTGIAANVVTVLANWDENFFQKLNNPERIALVTQLVKMSETKGVVNGCRAVKLAKFWNEISTEQKSPLKNLEELNEHDLLWFGLARDCK